MYANKEDISSFVKQTEVESMSQDSTEYQTAYETNLELKSYLNMGSETFEYSRRGSFDLAEQSINDGVLVQDWLEPNFLK